MDAILYGKTLLKRYMFYRIKGNIASGDVKSPVNVVFTGLYIVPKVNPDTSAIRICFPFGQYIVFRLLL